MARIAGARALPRLLDAAAIDAPADAVPVAPLATAAIAPTATRGATTPPTVSNSRRMLLDAPKVGQPDCDGGGLLVIKLKLLI